MEQNHPPTGPSRGTAALLSVPAIILLLLIWLVFIRKSNAPDEAVFRYIGPGISHGRTSFMKAITFLGNHKFLIPANLLLILLLLYRKKKRMALTVLVLSLSSLLLKMGLKELLRRPRPEGPMVDGITNFSFPSGHALMSITFFGLLIWMFRKEVPGKLLRNSLVILGLVLIGLIGFSRVYLRVHYASDVLAGYCIGLLWMWLVIRLLRYRVPA